jgi:hypothetical protein
LQAGKLAIFRKNEVVLPTFLPEIIRKPTFFHPNNFLSLIFAVHQNGIFSLSRHLIFKKPIPAWFLKDFLLTITAYY